MYDCCRQSKAELRTAAAKVDGMTKMMQNIQEQMQRRVSDGSTIHRRRNYCLIQKKIVGGGQLVSFPVFMFSYFLL